MSSHAPCSRAAGLAIAFKPTGPARDRWHAASAPRLIAPVRTGAIPISGRPVERPGWGHTQPGAARKILIRSS